MDTIPSLEARVRTHEDKSGRQVQHVGFAELTIGGSFVIKGIRIMKGPRDPEPFVVFPAEQIKASGSERWYDVAHPATKEARAAATKVILEEFKRVLEFYTCKCAAGSDCPHAKKASEEGCE